MPQSSYPVSVDTYFPYVDDPASDPILALETFAASKRLGRQLTGPDWHLLSESYRSVRTVAEFIRESANAAGSTTAINKDNGCFHLSRIFN